MKESDLNILHKSLKVISDFPDRVDMINSGMEFLIIHNRNLKILTDIAKERKSVFIKQRISEYPTLSETEIGLYIDKQKKEVSFLRIVGGKVIDFVYNLIKTKGTTLPQIKRKLIKIKDLNDKMRKVVEDPFYEEFYEKTMHNKTYN